MMLHCVSAPIDPKSCPRIHRCNICQRSHTHMKFYRGHMLRHEEKKLKNANTSDEGDVLKENGENAQDSIDFQFNRLMHICFVKMEKISAAAENSLFK